MNGSRSGYLALTLVVLVWLPSALADDELLAFVRENTEPLYTNDTPFERVLVDAAYTHEVQTLADAASHPFVAAAYSFVGDESNGRFRQRGSGLPTHDPFFVSEEVATIAEGYRAEPRSILAGYTDYASASEADGVISYTIPGNSAAPSYTLLVDESAGRIAGAYVGDEPYRSLEVTYEYDSGGAISRVVVEFATNADPGQRWALIDFPLGMRSPTTEGLPREGESTVTRATPTNVQTPSSRQTVPKIGVVSEPVNFVSSDDLIDPINLGSTSCDAEAGACFGFVGFDICFNISLGVALNTNTTLNMSGVANVEYPIGDQIGGDARVTFDGTNGVSSIDYSFAYNAEICTAVTVPVFGTCRSSFVLAQGSATAASGEQTFSPFLLPGDSERPVCTGDAIDPLFVGLDKGATLCDLELGFAGGLNIDPSLDYCISGDSMVIKNNAVDPREAAGKVSDEILTEGGEAWLPVIEGPNDFVVDWNGEASLAGSLTLTPVLGVTIPGIGDVSIPFPSFPFSIGSLGINDVEMSDMFEVPLCSVPPGHPYRVGATKGAATDRVVVQWERVIAATGYHVFRARKADLSDAVDISGFITEYQFSDTTATIGMGGCIEGNGPIEYYYYIVAVNDCGESGPSHTATGYVGEPNSSAMLFSPGFGDFCVLIIALAAAHFIGRRDRNRFRSG